jgi:hypothetical protein
VGWVAPSYCNPSGDNASSQARFAQPESLSGIWTSHTSAPALQAESDEMLKYLEKEAAEAKKAAEEKSSE